MTITPDSRIEKAPDKIKAFAPTDPVESVHASVNALGYLHTTVPLLLTKAYQAGIAVFLETAASLPTASDSVGQRDQVHNTHPYPEDRASSSHPPHLIMRTTHSKVSAAVVRVWQERLRPYKEQIFRYLQQQGRCASCLDYQAFFYQERLPRCHSENRRADLLPIYSAGHPARYLPKNLGIGCPVYQVHHRALLPGNQAEQLITQWLDLIAEDDPQQRLALLEGIRCDAQKERFWLEWIAEGDWIVPPLAKKRQHIKAEQLRQSVRAYLKTQRLD